jgi:hypothetical protein
MDVSMAGSNRTTISRAPETSPEGQLIEVGNASQCLLNRAMPEKPNTPPSRTKLLLVPWIVLVALVLTWITGSAERMVAAIPLGWGYLALYRSWKGIIALFVGCSMLWAYFSQRDQGYKAGALLTRTVLFGLLVFLAHSLIAFLLWLAFAPTVVS